MPASPFLLSPPPSPPALETRREPSDIEVIYTLFNRVHSSIGAMLFIKIHEADVYDKDPCELIQRLPRDDGEKALYVITKLRPKNQGGKRMNRCVRTSTKLGDSGYWHNEGKSKTIFSSEGCKMGHRSFFSFRRKGPHGKKARSGWCMWEYQLENGNEQNIALCKIYARSSLHRLATSTCNEVESSMAPEQVVAVTAAEAPLFQCPTDVPCYSPPDERCGYSS